MRINLLVLLPCFLALFNHVAGDEDESPSGACRNCPVGHTCMNGRCISPNEEDVSSSDGKLESAAFPHAAAIRAGMRRCVDHSECTKPFYCKDKRCILWDSQHTLVFERERAGTPRCSARTCKEPFACHPRSGLCVRRGTPNCNVHHCQPPSRCDVSTGNCIADPSFSRGIGGGGGATLVKPNVAGFSRDASPTAGDYYDDDGVSGDYSPIYDDGQGFQQPSALGFRSDVLPLSGRLTPGSQQSFFGGDRFNKDYYTRHECSPANCRFPKICDKGICKFRKYECNEYTCLKPRVCVHNICTDLSLRNGKNRGCNYETCPLPSKCVDDDCRPLRCFPPRSGCPISSDCIGGVCVSKYEQHRRRQHHRLSTTSRCNFLNCRSPYFCRADDTCSNLQRYAPFGSPQRPRFTSASNRNRLVDPGFGSFGCNPRNPRSCRPDERCVNGKCEAIGPWDNDNDYDEDADDRAFLDSDEDDLLDDKDFQDYDGGRNRRIEPRIPDEPNYDYDYSPRAEDDFPNRRRTTAFPYSNQFNGPLSGNILSNPLTSGIPSGYSNYNNFFGGGTWLPQPPAHPVWGPHLVPLPLLQQGSPFPYRKKK